MQVHKRLIHIILRQQAFLFSIILLVADKNSYFVYASYTFFKKLL